MYIISACLGGENCKYNGENNYMSWVAKLMEEEDYILVCPERAGGAETPRPPAEIIGGKVINKEGDDVTYEFVEGADVTMQTIKAAIDEGYEITAAILKANSPSCGCGEIYDGTFTGTKVEGDGIFAAMLKEMGVKIVNENDEELRSKYE